MSTVKSTFVIPDFGANQTAIDPDTGMAAGYTPASFGPMAALLGGDKPVKERQVAKTTPTAFDDMLKRRNTLDSLMGKLDNALKARESTGYSLANALANIPQQQGYGSWLTDFARALGGGMTNPINMMADREKTNFTNAVNLAKAGLDFDKAMGNTVETDYTYSNPGNSFASLLGLF